MATVRERINRLSSEERFVSFEFFPPKTDSGFRNLLARLNRMLTLNPLFITVTWGAGGSTSEKSLDLAATCQRNLGLTTVLHLTCTNTDQSVIDEALVRAKENGIRNILALRGDPWRSDEYCTPHSEFKYAVDLVRYIKSKYGDYFCIGVAGYPEGHVDGADTSQQDSKKDMPYLIEKIEAGADYIITQMFFDADKFIAYESLLRSYPQLKEIPLIPGLMPINNYKVLARATKLSHASIPEDLLYTLQEYHNDDDQIKKIGVDALCKIIDTINERTANRVKGYHFYCLNLEKAVASLMSESKTLNKVVGTEDARNQNEDALASDSDEETGEKNAIKSGRRRSSVVNDNELASNNSEAALIGKKLLGNKQTLVDISTGKGSLGKDATWDDFPNGRFGDSDSPAYGEIDGYGPTLHVSSQEEVIAKWGSPESVKDVSKVFINYLSGKTDCLPWVSGELSPETGLIQEELIELNKKGWFSSSSQPAVNACSSRDKIFGWGPHNGFVYQKSFVELFVPKKDWKDIILPKLQKHIQDGAITYYCGDCQGNVDSDLASLPDFHSRKNAITWGVFPLKEILQPTIIEYQSFKAWNEEAFILWLNWARCYKKGSHSYELLNSIYNNYFMVSIISHDFPDENALWRILLDN